MNCWRTSNYNQYVSSYNLLSVLLHNPYFSECIYNTSWLSLVSAIILMQYLLILLAEMIYYLIISKYYCRSQAVSNTLYVTMERTGVENGNLLQYSCLETSKDRGVWWATVHGVAKSRTQLSMHSCMERIRSTLNHWLPQQFVHMNSVQLQPLMQVIMTFQGPKCKTGNRPEECKC